MNVPVQPHRRLRVPRLRAWLALASALLLPGLAPAQQSYEAESAVLSNGASIISASIASGGRYVTNLGSDYTGMVTFNVNVASDGLYAMTVYYVTSYDRFFSIDVNHEPFPREVTVWSNTGKDRVRNITQYVPLKAGANTIAFSNPIETGPDLDRIVIGSAPVTSYTIAGAVAAADGSPLPNVRVNLSGPTQSRTTTDAYGRYVFPFLAPGDYTVTATNDRTFFSPNEYVLHGLAADAQNRNFAVRTAPTPNVRVMELAPWRIEYDLARGTANLFRQQQLVLANAYAAVRRPDLVTSLDYPQRTVTQTPIQDSLGTGVLYTIDATNNIGERMQQSFWLYAGADYFLTEVKLIGPASLSSNFMAPLVSHSLVNPLSTAGDHEMLYVRYDNDKWGRDRSFTFGNDVVSNEVSAYFNNQDRSGIVVGSVEHDLWKTGVAASTSATALTDLEVAGGVSNARTRDTLPHGAIIGTMIKSPRVLFGFFADWRTGMETYAHINSTLTPPRAWTKGTPFGWNSWGKLKGSVNYTKAIQVSDFFAQELQPRGFENNGVVYVGLDSGWNNLSDTELKQFVDHCHANGQEAGAYWAPFSEFSHTDTDLVEGTSGYHYSDIFLYANGAKVYFDSGQALDPTHPGTKQRIQYYINRFKQAGFAYLKLDFLTHGALEADRHYDPTVTTATQAYNQGMRFLTDTIGPDMYLNLAMSPLFPHQYTQSRRISGDSFGDMLRTEYTLNALTYSWWTGQLFRYVDADHVVLGDNTEGENRARTTSSVITGIFISGDDFSAAGSTTGKDRARKYLTNFEINAIAKARRVFRPAEGNTGKAATNLFVCSDPDATYLAAFNYATTPATIAVDFARLGLPTTGSFYAKELWSGNVVLVSGGAMSVSLPATDVALYRLYPLGDGSAPGHIASLSIRGTAGTGDQTLIAGFVVSSPGTNKPVLVRGIGPGLAAFGVSGTLADPTLTIFDPNRQPIANNNDWRGDSVLAQAFTRLNAFPLDPASKDAALLATLAPQLYTAQITDVAGGSGIALAEVYDADTTPPGVPTFAAVSRLSSISARAPVASGGQILIAGFTINGTEPKKVLIRGVGPSLAQYGVSGVLADPKLELFAGPTKIAANDDWSGTTALTAAFAAANAFSFTSPASKDAALLAVLPPGLYTAQVSGVGGATGIALVEVYEMP